MALLNNKISNRTERKNAQTLGENTKNIFKSNVKTVQQAQQEREKEKNSQTGKTPDGTSGTGDGTGSGTNSATDWIDLIKSNGNYDNSYWTRSQNALLSNNQWGLNKATEHEKYYQSLIDDYKNQNPLETDWGKAIMSQYGLDGDAAAKNEWADAAASNGGNIDSYAEANARRQRLSYLNSGVNAVNDASNQRFSNMLGALEKMGVNTQNLFGLSSQNAQSAMDASQSRYSDDTTATVSYNDMIQNILPTLLAEKYNTGTTALTPEESGNIGNALKEAYDKGGETGLISAGEMIMNQYGQNYPDIEDIVGRYMDIISGANGNTYYSGATSSSDNKDKHTIYDRGILSYLAGSEDRYKQLSETERERFEKLAKGYGYDSVYEWAKDARDGKTYVPDWITNK